MTTKEIAQLRNRLHAQFRKACKVNDRIAISSLRHRLDRLDFYEFCTFENY